MAYCIQDGFSHDTLIKRGDVEHKEALLIMLFIIPQVDQLPNAIVAGKEARLEFFPLVCGAGGLGRAVFKDDLRLWQKSDECLTFSKQDQCGIRHPCVGHCTTVNENLFL